MFRLVTHGLSSKRLMASRARLDPLELLLVYLVPEAGTLPGQEGSADGSSEACTETRNLRR